ncbi:MAG TPA: type II toxin-antitoxin system RelE/ParE family toxin [Methanocorpusculum sp.]|nr:type II toxin-antitoxin system RelE/ParE family toxin [Methanocorpusculum sp.]
MYKIVYTSQAHTFLKGLDKKTAERIRNKINRAAADPYAYSFPLTDMDSMRKIRVGDFRVIIDIDCGNVTVMVVRIKHRRNVYK